MVRRGSEIIILLGQCLLYLSFEGSVQDFLMGVCVCKRESDRERGREEGSWGEVVKSALFPLG